MKTEKQKMLSGEPYQAWDKTLYNERIACRHSIRELNDSIPNTPEWQSAMQKLLPNAQQGVYIEPPFRCDYGSNIFLGKDFYANFNCVMLDVNTIEIGNNVMFAPNVQVYTAGHPLDVKGRVEDGIEFGLAIKIGNNVWVGGGAIICPGVSIGDNTVIGAGSVVCKNIPANVVAAGNPCRIIKKIEQSKV